MALYVHKKLQVLVTDSNYTEFGIANLEDPDIYRVIDVPEDVDFLENNVIFGEPTWDEEHKTVFLHPTISPIDEAYKQHLLKSFRDSCFQDILATSFTEAWREFTFFSTDKKERYRLAADISNLLQYARRGLNSWVPFSVPVFVCDKDNPDTIIDSKVIHLTATEVARLNRFFSEYVINASHIGERKYTEVLSLPYDQVVRIIKQRNAAEGIIPDDIADVITFKKDKDQINRTISKRS